MTTAFDGFRLAFSPDPASRTRVDLAAMVSHCSVLGIKIPILLQEFWEEFGSGYFGEKLIYFFGSDSSAARDSFQEWNGKDFWRDVYPPASKGGPIFFAENCFGDQVGFRWENGVVKFVLFCVDTFDAFLVAEGDDSFFRVIMSDKYALLDREVYHRVRRALGPLADGMHYAPIVSPMVGGSDSSENFASETPNVHFRTAIATRSAIRGEPR